MDKEMWLDFDGYAVCIDTDDADGTHQAYLCLSKDHVLVKTRERAVGVTLFIPCIFKPHGWVSDEFETIFLEYRDLYSFAITEWEDSPIDHVLFEHIQKKVDKAKLADSEEDNNVTVTFTKADLDRAFEKLYPYYKASAKQPEDWKSMIEGVGYYCNSCGDIGCERDHAENAREAKRHATSEWVITFTISYGNTSFINCSGYQELLSGLNSSQVKKATNVKVNKVSESFRGDLSLGVVLREGRLYV